MKTQLEMVDGGNGGEQADEMKKRLMAEIGAQIERLNEEKVGLCWNQEVLLGKYRDLEGKIAKYFISSPEQLTLAELLLGDGVLGQVRDRCKKEIHYQEIQLEMQEIEKDPRFRAAKSLLGTEEEPGTLFRELQGVEDRKAESETVLGKFRQHQDFEYFRKFFEDDGEYDIYAKPLWTISGLTRRFRAKRFFSFMLDLFKNCEEIGEGTLENVCVHAPIGELFVRFQQLEPKVAAFEEEVVSVRSQIADVEKLIKRHRKLQDQRESYRKLSAQMVLEGFSHLLEIVSEEVISEKINGNLDENLQMVFRAVCAIKEQLTKVNEEIRSIENEINQRNLVLLAMKGGVRYA